jgi:DNA-binding transcriptional LysR family regulator
MLMLSLVRILHNLAVWALARSLNMPEPVVHDTGVFVFVQVQSFEAVCKLVQANMGIGVLPEAPAVDFAPVLGLRLIRLTDAWADRDMYVCVRDFDSLSANGRRLVEQLVGTAGLRNQRSPA